MEFRHDLEHVHRDRRAGGHHRLVGRVVLDERHVVRAAAVRDERVVVDRHVGDPGLAARQRQDRSVPVAGPHQAVFDLARRGLHLPDRQRVDGRAPGLVGVAAGLADGERAERLQRRPVGVREDVQLQIAGPRRAFDLLSDEHHPVRLRRVDVDVEAVREGRRQSREEVASVPQLHVAGVPDGEAVGLGEVAVGERQRSRARDGRVDERDDRVRAVRAVRPRHRIGHRHRGCVPDLGEAVDGRGQGLADTHRRDLVVGRPGRAPLPRKGRQRREAVQRRIRHGEAVEPAHEGADGRLGLERREEEALLHRVEVVLRGRAVAARPHAVVLVAVDDEPVVVGVRRAAVVLLVVVAVEEVERVRSGQQVADRDVGRERRMDRVGELDVEDAHRALAGVVVLDEHERPRRGRRVEVAAKRVRDEASVLGMQEGVLLVRIVADLRGVVLHVDARLDLVAGRDHAGRERGAAGLHREAAARGHEAREHGVLRRAVADDGRMAEILGAVERPAVAGLGEERGLARGHGRELVVPQPPRPDRDFVDGEPRRRRLGVADADPAVVRHRPPGQRDGERQRVDLAPVLEDRRLPGLDCERDMRPLV